MKLTKRVFTNADKEIVKYDGSEVSWRISAYVVIIRDDRVLLVKSKDEKVYDVPGGGIEIGESIEEAIQREVMEEAGAKVKIGQLIDAVDDWFYYKKGTYHQTVQLYYLAELVGEVGKPTDEAIHFVEFVPLADIEKYVLPDAVERVLNKIKKNNSIFIGKDCIGVGVGALIFNKDGKLLLTKRGQLAKNECGKWEIPGGAVEFGETIEQALKREIKEELDIEITIIEMLQLCDHILPEEGQHWVSPTYICEIVSGEPKNMEPGKCDEIGWFTLEEAEKLPLSKVTKEDIKVLKKRNFEYSS